MRRPATAALLLFAGWTLVGYYFATQAHYGPAHYPWTYALGINLTYYYLWGLFTPLVFFLGRRFPFDSGKWRIALPVHVGASIVLTSIQIFLAESFLTLVHPMPREGSFGDKLLYAFGANFHSSLP